MAEIDDDQLALLQKGMTLLTKLSTDAKTRTPFERLLKEHNPDIQTSEDVAAQYAAPYLEKVQGISDSIEARLKALDEREAAQRESQEMRDTEEAFSRLRSSGYTDDGMNAIKQMMIDRRIADPEAAAALFDRQNPKLDTRPAAWEPDSWNYQENAVGDDMAGLLKDPDRWADKQVAIVLNEMRRGE